VSIAGFTIRPILEQDWAEYRAIRLKMLAEIPLAFGETLHTAERRTEAAWRARVQPVGGGIRLVAVDESNGRWAGTMGGVRSGGPGVSGAVLVGVYVDPDYRGASRGVTDALLAAVEDWARESSTTLTLRVHEENSRARSAYRRRGFEENGRTAPYPLDPSQRELEMVKPL
jgi:ribosomal protein S18 acetylase RimI-like enzyme